MTCLNKIPNSIFAGSAGFHSVGHKLSLPTDEYVYSTQHFDLLQYYACRNVPQNGKKNDSIFALAAMCVCMYFGVLCLSVLALFWLSPAHHVRC